jgi:hypothetical protein
MNSVSNAQGVNLDAKQAAKVRAKVAKVRELLTHAQIGLDSDDAQNQQWGRGALLEAMDGLADLAEVLDVD